MGVSYNPRIVTDGLVLCLDAANKRSYPGAGTTWTDLSNQNNNGTLINGPTFDSANGGSIVFDGNDDYVEFVNSQSQSGLTLSAWCKFDSSVLTNSQMLSIADETVPDYSSIMWKNIGNVLYLTARQADGTANDAIESVSSNDDQWHHVVGVFNGTTQVLYVDGSLSATNTATPSLTTTTRGRVGMSSDSTPIQNFPGNIALAQIYNRVLSAQEIKQNYKATKGRFEV